MEYSSQLKKYNHVGKWAGKEPTTWPGEEEGVVTSYGSWMHVPKSIKSIPQLGQ